MEEDIYLTLFKDTTTYAVLKSNALDLVNNWYCGKTLEIADQADPSLEAAAMITMVKKILFSNRARNGNFIIMDDLEDFGHMLDLYYDNNIKIKILIILYSSYGFQPKCYK